MLQVAAVESSQRGLASLDILEVNRMRRSLLIGSHAWDLRLYSLDSHLKTNSVVKAIHVETSNTQVNESRGDISYDDCILEYGHVENVSSCSKSPDFVGNDLLSELNKNSLSFQHLVDEDSMMPLYRHDREEEVRSDGEIAANNMSFNDIPSKASNLSDRIDSAWTVRVHSFDSALRFQERIRKGLPPSLYLSTLKSFHASGYYRSMVRDPISNATRTHSQILPLEAQILNLLPSSAPTFISTASHMAGGARLLLPQRSHNDIVIGVYDNDPASIVSYALSSKEYEDWVAGKSNENEGSWSMNEHCKDDFATSTFSAWQSFGSADLDYIRHGSYGSEDPSTSIGTLFMDSKRSPHLTITYADDSSTAGGKVKFSVTCYFAKQFDSLRKKCCPSEVDFVRSLSRCQRWSAQGGKSNVYFAKSLDERFIIKQVKKTELESFEEFASEYFKYLTDSLSSGSPTCLAKVLGIYQSVDVMDYSLLVGLDNERKELVVGIIDFMRQYTWDKHLETWVKASGILGGPKNASPTIISPKQYKKRFRKAMTSYFLTVPDQWSS
ncbi:hypothetical protein GH714_005902 [Hevea brasiliensis]|uniref:PIPK domain-containing protein n=1 Tax=Hevea brasiliensis TaxID=3981 RepID=A0A6A6NFT0_HEVBR|nr:hypothetical protein GH714_005902 [Hevea brasiliensis]